MADHSMLSDVQLMGLIKSGDESAFAEIYDRYNKLLNLYAYRKLEDEEEAKDLIQDVFIWLWNGREGFELKTTLSGYLYKTVLNKIFDIFRRKEIIRKYIENGDHFIEVDSYETDYLIREKDITILIEKEIASMPPRMKEIFELKSKSFLSTKEIAEQLGLSEHTVSTQLKRASKHLKTKLGIVIWVLYILNH